MNQRLKSQVRNLIKRKHIPLRLDCDLENPVFVLGAGRSGNTLVRRGLVEHSELVIPPETYVLGDIIKTFMRYNHMGWERFVNYFLGAIYFHPEYVSTFDMDLRALRDDLMNVEVGKRSLGRILDGFYSAYAKENDLEAARWGDKTPYNSFSAWDIQKMYPQGIYLWMLRDPVDAVASYLRAGIYTNADGATRRCRVANSTLIRFCRAYPSRSMVVNYEALVSDYKSVVEKICKFCGLEYREQVRTVDLGDVGVRKHHARVLNKIDDTSIGKGREEFGEKISEQIENDSGQAWRSLKKNPDRFNFEII